MFEDADCVLNLGSGSVDLSRYKANKVTVHVDGCYREDFAVTPWEVEKIFDTILPSISNKQIFCRSDIFEFVEKFPFKFDYVYAERIFEHMEYVGGEIGRLLEGINRITKNDAVMEIVVPNGHDLAELLIDYEKDNDEIGIIESTNIKLLINTEFCNIKADPHGSVWTPKLAKEYIESEGTWKIEKLITNYKFAGRSIYMKIVCQKTTK